MTHHHTPSGQPADRGLDEVATGWGAEPVLAAIAETDATPPPTAVRRAVLEHAARSPRRQLDPVDPRDLYASRVTALAAILAELDPADWAMPAAPYGWTVHGLVAHLLVIERYTASQFGVTDEAIGDDLDLAPELGHLEIGSRAIEVELSRAPGETAVAWAAAADLLVGHNRSSAYAADTPAPLHGWPFSKSSALVARAFEIWTHADDICRATGRAATPPPPSELRTMSSFAVGALPFLLELERPGRQLAPTRIVLTGSGGGTFDIGPAEGERTALLSADVIDYCRVVARRIPVAELASTRDGDLALLDDLLTVAGAFAV